MSLEQPNQRNHSQNDQPEQEQFTIAHEGQNTLAQLKDALSLIEKAYEEIKREAQNGLDAWLNGRPLTDIQRAALITIGKMGTGNATLNVGRIPDIEKVLD